MSDIKMLNTKDVSEILGVGINLTRKIMKLPSFPKIMIGKKKCLVSEEALKKWIEESTYMKYKV